MRERLKRVVLKTTVRGTVPGVRIPLPPPCFSFQMVRELPNAFLRKLPNSSGHTHELSIKQWESLDAQSSFNLEIRHSPNGWRYCRPVMKANHKIDPRVSDHSQRA